jgi:hypothetical protein
MNELSDHSTPRSSITRKVSELAQARSRIESAGHLTPFHYKAADIHSPENTVFSQREPHANLLFNIDIDPNSDQYYSFLKSLQSSGFDVYAMLSTPKEGEMASPIHGNISLLKEILQESSEERKAPRTGFVRNKLRQGGYFKEGRFHIRIYPGAEANTISITAHIDPPDFWNHANILNHLKDKVETDYENGEKLLTVVLASIGGVIAEETLDTQPILELIEF